MLEELKKEVYAANMLLPKFELGAMSAESTVKAGLL